MVLRAKQPEAVEKRLKMLLFGQAGVGKTTACLQFPNAYIIDAEKGTDHYADTIRKSGGVVFQTTDMGEILAEVKSLLTEKHEYKTLIIDPVTPLYQDLLDKSELKVGSDFGRHYGEANKHMKRLVNMLLNLDMNVIITAHAKNEYGQNMVVLGQTFDGWKRLDYIFDLVLRLDKKGKERIAHVAKTRLEAFPDQDYFPWSYAEFQKRYGANVLERQATQVRLASPEQATEAKRLVELLKVDDETVAKWHTKAGVEDFGEYSAELIEKVLKFCNEKIHGTQKTKEASK